MCFKFHFRSDIRQEKNRKHPFKDLVLLLCFNKFDINVWTGLWVMKINLNVAIIHYCVCVKRIAFSNCLCSSSSSSFFASRVQNIGASHIWDFGVVITRKAMFVVTSSSCQKTDSAISKNNSSFRPGLPLQKSYLWSSVVSAKAKRTFNFIVTNN